MLASKMLAPAIAGGAGLMMLSANKPSTTLTARKQSVFAAASAPAGAVGGPFGNPAHDWNYYGLCLIGGIMSCGLTHFAITPLDVVKCRIQTMPDVYKGLGQGISLASKEGALMLGWLPTLIGYSSQGMFKFGLYEIFKDYYASLVGAEAAVTNRTYLYLAASASAEVVADAALCPFEAVKVKMQTSAPGTFPTTFGAAWSQVATTEGFNGFYKGIYPLWGRQVPYTMVKFASFERTVEAFYKYVLTEPKQTYSKTTQLSVTFASGYIAGVLCALVSQPADTMVSKMNAAENKGLSAGQIYSKIGFAGLWKGLGTRVVMVGTLTGLQWWIYDSFKTVAGLQASGGVVAPK